MSELEAIRDAVSECQGRRNMKGRTVMKPDNPQAFPMDESRWPGMTLRDWFAGQALAGAFVSDSNNSITTETMARWAYEAADAMLTQRNEEG